MEPLAGGNLDDWELALRYIAASGVIDIMIPGMGSLRKWTATPLWTLPPP